jgi:hypothetical protein
MWEAVIAGAGSLVGLYVALRQEVRRSHDNLATRLVQIDSRFDRMDSRFDRLETEVRADIRRLDQKVDAVRGELINFLGPRAS